MKGEERRRALVQALGATVPVSAGALAEKFGVSRQVIVQDIALIRTAGTAIISTPRGYLLQGEGKAERKSRTFKVRHADERTEEELQFIVSLGGKVENVYVHHRVYGKIEAPLNLENTVQVKEYMRSITAGKSSLLKNVTDGYHYHTVSAESEEVLDKIEAGLRELGFLIER